MTSINKILVANRGEIAQRIMRTCRAMGIATVAVYSDADRDAPFVAMADEAFRIGPPAPRESYLDIAAVITTAQRSGADAIHPGFGFLSENAAFAQACVDAGVIFVGPTADVIRRLGGKQAAKRLATAAGVPTAPGYTGDDQSTATLVAAAKDVGFPLLVKASAGGGGKGMRIVRAAGELSDALDRARGEAASAFGDATLILERYIERPRHIEVQILGDHHGTLVHLGERECSIQRRHQKVVEEAPSPVIDEATRDKMGAAAVALGKAVNYTNAGTVEFIRAPDGAFYFLEVNTRLQVEHPVTECVYGLDLVREQIRIARGEKLGYDRAPARNGHAIEVRLYAEDADGGYLPTIGPVLDFDIAANAGVRVDGGVAAGGEVSIHYDPMLAKVIAHGATRDEAAQRLRAALQSAWIPGLVTNRAFLARVLAHPEFLAGQLDTHFLERNASALLAPVTSPMTRAHAAAAIVLDELANGSLAGRGPSRLDIRAGWRNVSGVDAQLELVAGDETFAASYLVAADGSTRVRVGDVEVTARYAKRTIVSTGSVITAELADGGRLRARIARDGDRVWVGLGNDVIALAVAPRFPPPARATIAGALIAPMPGKVVSIAVAVGQAVEIGTPLLVVEAMKMEHAIKAQVAGTVEAIHVTVGEQVSADQLLAVVTPEP